MAIKNKGVVIGLSPIAYLPYNCICTTNFRKRLYVASIKGVFLAVVFSIFKIEDAPLSDADSEEEPILDDSDDEPEEEFQVFNPTDTFLGDATEGDYVLTEFETDKKDKKIYYIGKDYEMSFLKHSEKMTGKFVMPQVPNIETVSDEAIRMILPRPMLFGSTKRQMSHYSFEVDFGGIEMR